MSADEIFDQLFVDLDRPDILIPLRDTIIFEVNNNALGHTDLLIAQRVWEELDWKGRIMFRTAKSKLLEELAEAGYIHI